VTTIFALVARIFASSSRIEVERHDVIAVAVVEREFDRLAETEIHHVVEHLDVAPRPGDGLGQFTRAIDAAVIDKDDLPPTFILE